MRRILRAAHAPAPCEVGSRCSLAAMPRLSALLRYDREGPKLPPVGQLIGHKIQAPDLVRCRWPEAIPSMLGSSALSPRSLLQRQAFFPIESIHQLLPNFPALAVQPDPDLAVAVSDPCLCDLPDPYPQLNPRVLDASTRCKLSEGFEGSALVRLRAREQSRTCAAGT